MRVFPFSLTGTASKWWEDESIGSATKRGADEEVICGNEVSKDENLTEENEIAQIFRIDTNLYHFETPLCQAFKEFNYLSQMDADDEDEIVQYEIELNNDEDDDMGPLNDHLVHRRNLLLFTKKDMDSQVQLVYKMKGLR
ncbi:hypothetical protein Tco_0819104 [Tanacetum coccineum]|uniref:Uncharacterized protein n=1 Tax=Tanacetum coccineum TaxID=301880 RepID=A0ABQ5A5K6_9ASTR